MEEKNTNIPWYKRVEGITFGAAFGVIIAFFIWALTSGDQMGATMSNLLGILTHQFGWLYLMFGFLSVIFALWLALGPYGNIKLGKDDEKPKYSYFSWFSMLFACGYGIGLVYWGAAEPLSFFMAPPFGIEPGSARAAEIGLAYAYFHWGWTPWAMYLAMSVPLGYFIHRRGLEPRFASGLQPILGDRIDGTTGKLINAALIIGLVGGETTSIGLGILQVSAGLNTVFGIPISKFLYLIIGVLWIAIFTTSAISGLDKGIKTLSSINIPLAMLIMLFILFAGPTMFSVDLGTSAFGDYLTNFFKMSFWTDPVNQGGFPQGWTIFYWAWWIACCPVVGLFVATISRGRTIKEVVGSIMVVAPLATWLWFATFGGTAINFELNGLGLGDVMATQGTNQVIFTMIDNLPMSKLLGLGFLVLIIIFMATTADSCSYIMAQVTTKKEYNPSVPPKAIRAVWAIAMGGLSMVLVMFGKGINGLQLASVAASFFVIFVIIAMVYCLIKALKEEKLSKTNSDTTKMNNLSNL